MTNNEHQELASVLHDLKGKVALSGYHCNLTDRLYADWYCVEAPEKNCHSVKKPRIEVLWTNYKTVKEVQCKNPQMSLI